MPASVLSLALGLPGWLDSCAPDCGVVALGVLAREQVAPTATAAGIGTDLPLREGAGVATGAVPVRLKDRPRCAMSRRTMTATANWWTLIPGRWPV